MPNPKRGEVWWVDMEPVVGLETGKARPAVVMQDDLLGSGPLGLVTNPKESQEATPTAKIGCGTSGWEVTRF